MNYRWILGVVLWSVISAPLMAQKNRPILHTINFYITSTSQYCGGAPPPKEYLDALNTPQPLANKKLYLRRDTQDIRKPMLYTLTTNDSGRVSIRLKAGKYVVVDETKKDMALYHTLCEKYKEKTNKTGPIDPKCLMDYMSTADFGFEVKPSRKIQRLKVSHNYFKSCNWAGVPCVNYTGYYPE